MSKDKNKKKKTSQKDVVENKIIPNLGVRRSGILPCGKEVATKEDVERRKRTVMELRASGKTIKEISRSLEISEALVRKDIYDYKKKLGSDMKNVDRDEVVGEVLSWWDLVLANAFTIYGSGDKVHEKNQVLNTMIKTIKGRQEFMFDTGILNKVTKGEAKQEITVNGIPVDELEKLSMHALEKLLQDKQQKISKMIPLKKADN